MRVGIEGFLKAEVNYLLDMQVYFRSIDHHGELTDEPIPSRMFTKDDFIYTWYDAKLMRWLFSRPSRIKYSVTKKEKTLEVTHKNLLEVAHKNLLKRAESISRQIKLLQKMLANGGEPNNGRGSKKSNQGAVSADAIDKA